MSTFNTCALKIFSFKGELQRELRQGNKSSFHFFSYLAHASIACNIPPSPPSLISVFLIFRKPFLQQELCQVVLSYGQKLRPVKTTAPTAVAAPTRC